MLDDQVDRAVAGDAAGAGVGEWAAEGLLAAAGPFHKQVQCLEGEDQRFEAEVDADGDPPVLDEVAEGEGEQDGEG